MTRLVHCWTDGPRQHTGTGHVLPELNGICTDSECDCVGSTRLLPDGHAGPHEWTSDAEIGLSFVGEPPTPEAA